MKQITIIRDGTSVTFKTVNIDTTENVFFTNMDPQQPHKPSILKLGPNEQLGTAPSPNSSQVPVPVPYGTNPNPPPPTIAQTPYQFEYTCEMPGHQGERGIINVYAQLAAPKITALKATKGKATNQPVVVGGMPTYTITGLIVNNANVPGSSNRPGQSLPIGSDLTLIQNDQGISVVGTPSQAETYNFTFTVNDKMGRNLQQVLYSITVS